MIFPSFSRWLKKPLVLSELRVILYYALFFAIVNNSALWRKLLPLLDWSQEQTYLLVPSFFLFLWAGLAAIFGLLLWRPWFRPLLALLLVISAAVNYFSFTYGVYIDREMVTNMMRTETQEAMGLLTPQLILWMIAFALLPTLVLFKIKLQPGRRPFLRRILFIFLCLLTVLGVSLPLFKDYASFFRNHKQLDKLIVPVNYVHAVISYGKFYRDSHRPLVAIGTDARLLPAQPGEKPTLFVVVVGETSRAQDFSLLGYDRNTNPLLAKQKDLVVFRNATSCGTATAHSVPCMFSNMTREQYSATQAAHQENVLDILQRAGVSVLWKDNNAGCQGVCKRLETREVRAENPQGCPGDYCYDEKLLNNLDDYIRQRRGKNMVIVLHTIGSHGPAYYRRYDRSVIHPFAPACETNQIQRCSQQSLVNVYDNTILYVDYMLNQTIETLKKYESQYQVAMLYMSDHGESLGEKGVYLHGLPYMIAPKEQTHIPMLFWGSEEFMQRHHIDPNCLRAKAQRDAYSHDNLFHSLLGALHVATREYQPALDIFNTCQMPAAGDKP